MKLRQYNNIGRILNTYCVNLPLADDSAIIERTSLNGTTEFKSSSAILESVKLPKSDLFRRKA